MPIDNLKNKWKAFGWNVHYLDDGHNYDKIKKLLNVLNLIQKNLV